MRHLNLTKQDFMNIPGVQFVTSYVLRQNLRYFTEDVLPGGPVVLCNGDSPRAVLMDLPGVLAFLKSDQSPYKDLPIRQDPAEAEHAMVQDEKESEASYDLPLYEPIAPFTETTVDGIRYFQEGNQICAVDALAFLNLEVSPAGFGSTMTEARQDLEASLAIIAVENETPVVTDATDQPAAEQPAEQPVSPTMEADLSDEGEMVEPKELPLCQVNVLNPDKSCTFGATEGTPAPAVRRVIVSANGTTYPECNVCQAHLASLSERVKVEEIGEPV